MEEISDQANKIVKARFYQSLAKDPLARMSVEFIATVFFIVVLFIVAIRPSFVTISKIQNSLDLLNTFNSSLLTKIDTLKKLTILYQNNKQKFDLLDTAIPQQPDFSVLEKQIRYLVNQNNFEILSLTFTQIPLIGSVDNDIKNTDNLANDASNTITFNLAASGDYESIKNFISQLQTLNRLVTIQNFTISQSMTNTNELNFALSVVVYYGIN